MPNGEDKKLNFVLKVFDQKTKQWRPVYIAPDATDRVQGDVFLSDATDDKLKGVLGQTAATPRAVATVLDVANTKLSKTETEQQSVTGPVRFAGRVDFDQTIHGDLEGTASTASQLLPGLFLGLKSGPYQNEAVRLTGKDTGSPTYLSLPGLDARTLKGVIPFECIPQGALEKLVKVANQEARFALTQEQVQDGDSVLQLDTGVMYVVINQNSLDSESGYQEYKAATSLKAIEAEKLGSATLGSVNQPIFLENGTPKVIEHVGVEHGGTGAGEIPTIANNLKYSSIGLRAGFTEAVDLNTMKTVGSYFCSKDLEPQVANKPQNNKTENSGFALDVISNVSGNENYLRQVLRYSNSAEEWERLFLTPTETDDTYPVRNEQGWTPWISLGSESLRWHSVV